MKSFYSIIVLSFILASCSTSNSVTSNHFFQKRKYTSGWNLNHSTKIVSSNEESINETPNPESSLSTKIKTAEPLKLDNSNLIEQSECDTIILNNGKIVRVNIINTTATLVRYTKCDSEDQTELILAKEEVKALQYANGDFEFIRNGPTPVEIHQNGIQNDKNKKINKERHPGIFALLMILFGLAAFGFLIMGAVTYEMIWIIPGAIFAILSLCFFIAFLVALTKNRERKKDNLKNTDPNFHIQETTPESKKKKKVLAIVLVSILGAIFLLPNIFMLFN